MFHIKPNAKLTFIIKWFNFIYLLKRTWWYTLCVCVAHILAAVCIFIYILNMQCIYFVAVGNFSCCTHSHYSLPVYVVIMVLHNTDFNNFQRALHRSYTHIHYLPYVWSMVKINLFSRVSFCPLCNHFSVFYSFSISCSASFLCFLLIYRVFAFS